MVMLCMKCESSAVAADAAENFMKHSWPFFHTSILLAELWNANSFPFILCMWQNKKKKRWFPILKCLFLLCTVEYFPHVIYLSTSQVKQNVASSDSIPFFAKFSHSGIRQKSKALFSFTKAKSSIFTHLPASIERLMTFKVTTKTPPFQDSEKICRNGSSFFRTEHCTE